MFSSKDRIVHGLVGAAVGAAALLVGVAPAAAAPGGLPDLKVAVGVSSNPIPPDTAFTYTLTITNQSYEACVVQRPNCEPVDMGSTATNVTLTDTLPPGATYLSVAADPGWTCFQSNGVVTCSGGTVPRDGVARITISMLSGSSPVSLTNIATVDPNNTIHERIETNNSASVTANVVLPDLAITSFTQSNPSSAVGAYNTYTIAVYNSGPYTPSNVQVFWDANWDNGTGNGTVASASSPDTSFECPVISTSNTVQLVGCVGGVIAPGQTVHVTLTVLGSATPTVATANATVDPNNLIPEVNESNNHASLTTTFR
jgi:hypothetical protein